MEFTIITTKKPTVEELLAYNHKLIMQTITNRIDDAVKVGNEEHIKDLNRELTGYTNETVRHWMYYMEKAGNLAIYRNTSYSHLLELFYTPCQDKCMRKEDKPKLFEKIAYVQAETIRNLKNENQTSIKFS